MHRLFFLVPTKLISYFLVMLFSLTSTAAELANEFPLAFGKIVLDSSLWSKKLDDPTSEEFRDIYRFAKLLKGPRVSNLDLAGQVLKNPNTYRFKYYLLKFLQDTPNERVKFPGVSTAFPTVWSQIPEIYLRALIQMIEESPVKEFYAPITQRLVEMQQRKEFSFVDLTPAVRKSWSTLTNKLHVSSEANTLTKDASGKYVVNGVYNNKSKVLAMDLSLSRDENLITFAHEIVHIADPEMLASNLNLQAHFSGLSQKLKILFPKGDVEGFLKSMIQQTFMEQGRLDIANIQISGTLLSGDIIRDTVTKAADQIKASGYDYLLTDVDFRGFIQNLVRVSVENEYKAYILSYALYSALKDENSSLMPPSKKRDQFIRDHFDHPAKLQDILKDRAKPFRSVDDPVVKLLPNLEGMTEEQARLADDEIQKVIELSNILKKLILNLYFTESRAMVEKTVKEFAPLYSLLSRINFSNKPETSDEESVSGAPPKSATISGAIAAATAQIIKADKLNPRNVNPGETIVSSKDEDFYAENEWLRPGGYDDSISNPYLLAEAKMGTAAIIRFRKNVEGLSRSLGTMHEALLTMMAGILPLNNLSFGELKWVGLINVNADANYSMPPGKTCSPAALRDMQKQDPETAALFSRFVYNKDNDLSSQYIQYDAARVQVFLMQLYKAVTWLRKEFPITRENFSTLSRFRRKLVRGEYKSKELQGQIYMSMFGKAPPETDKADDDTITAERAAELVKEIDKYLEMTRPRQDDLVHIETLMKKLLIIESASRKVNLFGLASEFQSRMDTARRYFNSLNLRAEVTPVNADELITKSVNQLRTEIRNSDFAAGCASRDDFDFNRAKKYVFNFGINRTIENLTLYCFNRQMYVLSLPCGWTSGATTSTTDPAGFNTKVFNDGRKLLMQPFLDLRVK